jgi:hypothetical protein
VKRRLKQVALLARAAKRQDHNYNRNLRHGKRKCRVAALLNFVPQSFAQLGTSHAQLLSISTPLKLQQVPKRQL